MDFVKWSSVGMSQNRRHDLRHSNDKKVTYSDTKIHKSHGTKTAYKSDNHRVCRRR